MHSFLQDAPLIVCENWHKLLQTCFSAEKLLLMTVPMQRPIYSWVGILDEKAFGTPVMPINLITSLIRDILDDAPP